MEWDLSQFGEGTIPMIGSGSGSSSSYGFKGNFSVDLKLGQVVDCSNNENSSVSKTSSSSSKRARVSSNAGAHTVSCLVDGCTADLSSCRDYHRRHKVCEIHSKTPNVSINGLNKRFCQQCSRFHSLDEFDEGKRSCRKRLDGHNRRRRKHQPEPLPRSVSYLTTNQGTRYIAFSSPQVYPTATMANSIWGGGITKPISYINYEEPSSYRDRKQLSFLQSTDLGLSSQSTRDAFMCQPRLKIPPETTANPSEKVLCDEFSNSDCALSLLSSSPTRASSYMGLSHTVHPMFSPSPAGMSYGGPQHVESLLVPNHRGSEEHRMFEMMPLAPRDDNEQTPFYWD